MAIISPRVAKRKRSAMEHGLGASFLIWSSFAFSAALRSFLDCLCECSEVFSSWCAEEDAGEAGAGTEGRVFSAVGAASLVVGAGEGVGTTAVVVGAGTGARAAAAAAGSVESSVGPDMVVVVVVLVGGLLVVVVTPQ